VLLSGCLHEVRNLGPVVRDDPKPRVTALFGVSAVGVCGQRRGTPPSPEVTQMFTRATKFVRKNVDFIFAALLIIFTVYSGLHLAQHRVANELRFEIG
jgi:hypothetical protein